MKNRTKPISNPATYFAMALRIVQFWLAILLTIGGGLCGTTMSQNSTDQPIPVLPRGESWQNCRVDGGSSFAEVKAGVQRVTSLHLYSGWDEKMFNRSGDLTAVAVLQVLTDAQLSNSKVQDDVLEILREAFSCPSRCITTVADRQPRVTLLLLDHLKNLSGNKSSQTQIEEIRKFILAQFSNSPPIN